MGKIAADRARRGLHRHRLDAEPLEGAQIGQQLGVIAVARASLVEVEAVGVLHQKFATAHHAETRTHLVAEFPLDMVEGAGQFAVAFDLAGEERGDHLLVGRAIQHFAIVAVLDAQHFRAVGVVAARLAPQFGRLQRRHQHLDRASLVLLLADDLLDLLENAVAERQPGINPGRGLTDQAGAEHQLVADDLGARRALLHHGQERAGQAQGKVFHLVRDWVAASLVSGPAIGNRRSSSVADQRVAPSPHPQLKCHAGPVSA